MADKLKVKFNSNIASASEGKVASGLNRGTLYFTLGSTENDVVNQKLFVAGRDYTGVKKVEAGSNDGTLVINGDTSNPVNIPGWGNKADKNNVVQDVTWDNDHNTLKKVINGGSPVSLVVISQVGLSGAYNDLVVKPTKAQIEAILNALYGVATLDVNGKVPASQLPSYVDDVITMKGCYEYAGSLYRPIINGKLKPNPTTADFTNSTVISPSGTTESYLALPYGTSSNAGIYHNEDDSWVRGQGEDSKIYVEESTNKTYRFPANNLYDAVEVSPSPGTTDDVIEGNNNKYFTEARAQAAVAASINAKAGKPSSSVAGHVAILTAEGNLQDGGYTIAADVPSGAVFTDSHSDYAGHYAPSDPHDLIIGTTPQSGNRYILEGVTVDGKGHIIGVRAVQATAAQVGISYINGVLTINGTDIAVEVRGNKVTSVNAQSNDDQYPTAKCLYDALLTKAGTALAVASVGGVGGSNGLMSAQDKELMDCLYWEQNS